MILQETSQSISPFCFYGRHAKFSRHFSVWTVAGGAIGCAVGCGFSYAVLVSMGCFLFLLNVPLIILGTVFNANIKMVHLELKPSGVVILCLVPAVSTALGIVCGSLVEKGLKKAKSPLKDYHVREKAVAITKKATHIVSFDARRNPFRYASVGIGAVAALLFISMPQGKCARALTGASMGLMLNLILQKMGQIFRKPQNENIARINQLTAEKNKLKNDLSRSDTALKKVSGENAELRLDNNALREQNAQLAAAARLTQSNSGATFTGKSRKPVAANDESNNPTLRTGSHT